MASSADASTSGFRFGHAHRQNIRRTLPLHDLHVGGPAYPALSCADFGSMTAALRPSLDGFLRLGQRILKAVRLRPNQDFWGTLLRNDVMKHRRIDPSVAAEVSTIAV